VLDVRMQGMSGLELQRELARRELVWPVIVITGHADVPMAIQAFKAGAVEFIQKPFEDQRLLECVRTALESDARERAERAERLAIAARIDKLTPREREVMDLVVDGGSNKAMAEALGVSAKTIEAHRASVMRKMEAGNVADLVRMFMVYRGRGEDGQADGAGE
jgi:FixJ family two-component response regulator